MELKSNRGDQTLCGLKLNSELETPLFSSPRVLLFLTRLTGETYAWKADLDQAVGRGKQDLRMLLGGESFIPPSYLSPLSC